MSHTIKKEVLFLLQAEKVEVTVTGNNWNEANAAAEEAVRTREGVFMVHPFGQVSGNTA